MTLGQQVRRLVPASVKRRLRGDRTTGRLLALLAEHLPAVVCIDVGASYFAHPRWPMFLASRETRWVAVEPNEANTGYVSHWSHAAHVEVRHIGLSRGGGPQTLHVTNVDSGSSLLRPEIPQGLERRITNVDYFFPIRETTVVTATLLDLIREQPAGLPVVVKLDTQGTELDILLGAGELLGQQIVGIELEATLQAEPIMRGSGKLWQVCEKLESNGYELIDLRPIEGPSRFGAAKPRGRTFLNECDAVFALRPSVRDAAPVAHRAALLGFYACYELYEEAASQLDGDDALVELLRQRGCDIAALRAALAPA